MASKDFFLDPDDAQTLGDIKFMRKSTRVRHTFPKNLKNPNGFEVVKDVSSVSDNSSSSFSPSNSSPSFSNTASQSTGSIDSSTSNTNSSQASTSSTSSNSMDMFRNMARNIGKR